MANKTASLARLIGHTFADGHIHKNKQYFIYVNSNLQMHKEVQRVVKELFGDVSLNKGTSISGTPRYQYSNRVGRYLASKGAPIGSKVLQKTKIPNWIRNGNPKIKSAFLGAIFDDEGYFRDSSNCRQIVFKAAKSFELRENLEEYLLDIISLLNSLGVKTSGVKSDQIKHNKNGMKMISLRFWITKNENFQAFRNKIQILHPERVAKLENISFPSG